MKLKVQRLYEQLKGSGLYDKEWKQWSEEIALVLKEGEQPKLWRSYLRKAKDQLYGVLVEYLFNKEEAREQYKALKESPLYDRERSQWYDSITGGQRKFASMRWAKDQLLGILIEYLFDKGTAEKKYRELREGPLYDREQRLWYGALSGRQTLRIEIKSYGGGDQLLGVLVEYLFDRETAEKEYRRLKEGPLYDREQNEWKEDTRRTEDQKRRAVVSTPERWARDQLLGVLVEYLFDRKAAEKQYWGFRNSPFYDQKRNEWKCRIKITEDQQTTESIPERRTEDQLLGILVEYLFDKEAARERYLALKESPLYDREKELWYYLILMRRGRATIDTRQDADDQLLGVLVEYLLETGDLNGLSDIFVK